MLILWDNLSAPRFGTPLISEFPKKLRHPQFVVWLSPTNNVLEKPLPNLLSQISSEARGGQAASFTDSVSTNEAHWKKYALHPTRAQSWQHNNHASSTKENERNLDYGIFVVATIDRLRKTYIKMQKYVHRIQYGLRIFTSPISRNDCLEAIPTSSL